MSDKVDDDYQQAPESNEEELTMMGSLCKKFKENWMSGTTVALVSVPLSTALAIASGCTPTMGISTAIYGPAVSGLIGGSNYNILGPAGALVNINHKLVMDNDDDTQIIPYVAITAGIMILFVWLLRLEKYCMIIPNSVLEGFSFGVAVTIGFGQLNSAFGIVPKVVYKKFYQNFWLFVQNLFDGQMDWKEFGPFLFFFVMLMSLLQWNPKRAWIIVVAFIGCLYGFVTSTWIANAKPVLLRDKYAAMKHPVKLVSFQYQEDMQIPFATVFVGAAKVAFVAVLETLISARIADNMTGTHFNQSHEVRGLAYANLLAGVMGGLPCTGVLIRTAVNAQSGATDKMSQFINAMVVLVFGLVLMPAFSFIPMSIVASILITSACRLVPKKFIAQTFIADKFECALILITTAACVLIDGALGLLIGSFIALLHHAVKSASPVMDIKASNDITQVTISGNVDFLNAYDFEIKIMNAWESCGNDVIVILK